MSSRVCMIALATAVVALGGCGDDDSITGTDTTSLSEAEVDELAGVIFTEAFLSSFTLGSEPQQAGGPQPTVATFDFDNTGPCPLGGEINVVGSVVSDTDDTTGAGTFTFSMDATHAGCVVRSDQGTQFTLTGNPAIEFDMEASSDGQDFGEFSGSITGGVLWATGDRDGSCGVNITFSGQASSTSFGFSIGGTVCNTTVDSSVSISTG